MQSIYGRIESLIKSKGMTKKLFCEKLGISTGNLGDWKSGKSTPSTNKLIDIAAFFNVSLDWLILGNHSTATGVQERNGDYLLSQIDDVKASDLELTEEEKSFIREYIAFTKYRREKDSE